MAEPVFKNKKNSGMRNIADFGNIFRNFSLIIQPNLLMVSA
jgi:hypothetical protein